ncbi:unnamed protein product [Closterium sp. Naga37s-1]|nr:unnamed protein product [Closterium sp. Naga37s-1]
MAGAAALAQGSVAASAQTARAAHQSPIADHSRPGARLSSRAATARRLPLAGNSGAALRIETRRAAFRRSAGRRVAVASLAEEERELEAVEALSDANWAHMSATWTQQVQLDEKEKPLAEYMTLPASQYSVLDAERIERVDGSTFRCYAHRAQFFSVEVCPVLLVRVDEEADGCTIRLLSATLDGSPIVKSQNKKFRASMANRVRWAPDPSSPSSRLIMSDTILKSSVEVPVPFRMIPREVIESAGNKLLEQVLKVAVPRFLEQLKKDYEAWASGDTSRKPLGTGEL